MERWNGGRMKERRKVTGCRLPVNELRVGGVVNVRSNGKGNRIEKTKASRLKPVENF
jgi:hypothetical protein